MQQQQQQLMNVVEATTNNYVSLFRTHLNYWLETNSLGKHYKSIIFSVCFKIVVLKLITNTPTLVFLLNILTLLGFRLPLHLHSSGLISLATPVQHPHVLSKERVMVHYDKKSYSVANPIMVTVNITDHWLLCEFFFEIYTEHTRTKNDFEKILCIN